MNDDLHRSTSTIWLIPLVLSTMGIVTIGSLVGWSLTSPGTKQAIWLIVSLFTFMFTTQIPLKFWFRMSGISVLLAFVMIVLTLHSPIAASVKGASRWIRLGPINFQPLELVSLSLMVHIAKMYSREPSLWKALIKTGCFVLVFGFLIMKQPDFGGLLLILALLAGLFVDRYSFLVPIGGIILGSPLLWFFASHGYRMERIKTWLDPWQDPMGSGYQVIQGLIAFANGGAMGIGISRGQGFLPEVHNDFIFPAIGEEFGLWGTIGVFLLFLIWSVAVLFAYHDAPTNRRSLIWGCCISVLLPFLINLGGVMKLIPLTGMPVPFVSYGGTSLMFMWIRIGLLVRLIHEEQEEEEVLEWA